MRWQGNTPVMCRECGKTWPAEKVKRNYYVVERRLFHGEISMQIMWGVRCRYCVCKSRKLTYASQHPKS